MPTTNRVNLAVDLNYVGPEDETVTSPQLTVAAPYAPGAIAPLGIDVPVSTAADTEYSVAFGSVDAATFVSIHNRSGVEARIRLEVDDDSVTGTLVSGTATIPFAAVPGERLYVTRTAGNGGTNGKLYVERSSGNVIVTSYYSSGVQTADVSSVKVYNNAPPAIANGGAMVIASPAAVAANAITGATVTIADEPASAGLFSTKVAGDPV